MQGSKEEFLQESEEKYRILFESANDAIWVTDADHVIDCNRKTMTMFGCDTKDQILEKSLFFFSPPLQPDGCSSREKTLEILRTASSGQPQRFEWTYRRFDGSQFDAEVSLQALTLQGRSCFQAIVRDISDRKRHEEALRKSEATYRALFEKSADAMLLIDGNRFVDCNQAAIDMLHASFREQILNSQPSQISPERQPDGQLSSEKAARMLAIAQETGSHRFEWRHQRFDGEEFTIEVVLTAIYQGQKLIFHVGWRDITLRKQAEETLRESEAKYRRLHESMTDALAVTDMNGRIVESNRAFQEMTGYSAGELNGMHYEELSPEIWHEREAEIIRNELLMQGSSDVFEKEYRRKDGTVFPVELRSYLIRNDTGDPAGMWAMIRDIEARKRVEKALRESEERFARAFQSNPAPMVITDPKTGLFIDVNDQWLRLTGHTREETIGHTSVELGVYADPATRKQMMDRLVRDGFFKDTPLNLRTKSGKIVYVLWSAEIISLGGKEVILSLLYDMTEQKKAEEALRESEALFRSQFEFGHIGIAITSINRRFLRVNSRLCNILGYREDELLRKTWTEITHPEDLDADLRQFDRMLEGEIDAYEADKRFFHKNGTIIFTHLTTSSFRTPGRAIRFVIASVQDITETVNYIEKLRTSETTVRALMNATTDALFLTDTTGTLIAMNEALSSRFGSTVEEMMGTNIYGYLPPDVAETRRAHIKEVIHTKRPVHFQDQRHGMWLENTFYPIFNHAGEVVMLAAYSRDITLRKQAENKLKEALDLNRKIVSTSTVGIAVFKDSGQCISANEAVSEILGISVSRMLEQNFHNLASWQKSGLLTLAEKALHTRKPEAAEIQMLTSSGKQIWINCSLSSFLSTGKLHLLVVVVNNTERKRAEMELQQHRDHLEEQVVQRTSELSRTNEKLALFRRFVEASGQGLGMTTLDGGIIYANPTLGRLIGEKNPDRLCSETIFQHYPGKYRNKLHDEIIPTVLREGQWIGELALVTSEGHEIPTIENIFLIRDEKGKPAFLADVLTDVREMKRIEQELKTYRDHLEELVEARTRELQKVNEDLQAEISVRTETEEALRESRRMLQDISDNIPGVIYRFYARDNGEMGVSYFSESSRSLFEISPDRPDIFEQFIEGVVPSCRSSLLDSIRDAVIQGKNWEFEGKYIRPSGDIIAFSGLSHPVRQGDTLVFNGVLLDISKRKKAEEEAHQLRTYLASIIDSMPSVLVGVDKDGHITQWNAAAERFSAIGADQAIGRPLQVTFPFLKDQESEICKAIFTRESLSYTKMPVQRGNEIRYSDITVYPLISTDLQGAVVRIDDVTERVRIEEMMIQTEKMLSVGGLAAGMAHEINNPLGIIMAAAQNVLRRVSPDIPANIQAADACGVPLPLIRQYLEKRQILTFLEDIRNGVSRATQIVSNMLSFSRIPEGRGIPEDISRLLDQTLLLAANDYDLKRKYDFRQIEIVREYDPATPPVICQASKVQQVFLNILRNGAEAMEENWDSGHPPRFILRVFPAGQWAQVEIEDNGPGMDEKTRRRVFEPFFSTKPPGIGTGLGLSVSYFIISDNHGGVISVESAPGSGARFIIRFPAQENRP